ncbi:uncharacterized protein LOC104896771 isoform X2 [Beta vulgaris subsp. vulgaris]|uniref:uncharacterized protein LOC104896771 isoform X2 n=1 Tax=Beta vulgaris subsp. vulgaris TaxID=3555 RepID=UPI0020367DC1|nr:uncharacterized protein LOC104896771 isoform X2 [Beta vulgaris subsp. vulgaris]
MAAAGKSLHFSQFSLLFQSSTRLPFLSFRHTKCFLSLLPSVRPLSSSTSPYPLQFDMIISRPSPRLPPPRSKLNEPNDSDSPESDPSAELSPELSFEDWVDKKLTETESERFTKANKTLNPHASVSGCASDNSGNSLEGMDKTKRKYYSKRKKRMYGGSDSDDERRKMREKSEVVELKPEVVELRTLHKREEELYFYDTFAFPWEKEKHYKMVYQLEKKYFPDQCLDQAFLQPGQSNTSEPRKKRVEKGEEDKGLVFFDQGRDGLAKDGGKDISEKKVEDFFKCLKKVPNKNGEVCGIVEPFLASRTFGLPSKWDSPAGTVVLVNKPKGWTSFTVCGKLRRLTKIKKVGHAGTLDPMATGLLIVCVGKSTKVVDRYQGMIKGYSGVFRLGEATSTWDADSPVIQREPWEHIKDEEIRKAAASFTGEIWQVPPMFSAIKVGGEKMYEKARRGESIELSPRRISILQFDIERSLEDSCAHLTALRRDSIGDYTADDAYEFQELEEQITKMYL